MSWRTSPFIFGKQYKAKKDFASGSSYFTAGEILVFEKAQYSHYDSSSVYVFNNVLKKEAKEWWLRDDQPLESWQEYFQPL